MSTSDDLRRRREALQTELNNLRDQRERASRTNSYARSRQQAGVTDHSSAELKGFDDDEVAGDGRMSELRREIESLDGEISRTSGGGLVDRARRLMSRSR
jgi:hypothetical protein